MLLAVLLGQPHAVDAARIWDRHAKRIASILLEAECRTVLRRAARATHDLPAGWLRARERDLDTWLDGVALHMIARSVVDRLGVEPALGACRTLDALHLATALKIRDGLGSSLTLCTFDRELARASRALGFTVEGVTT